MERGLGPRPPLVYEITSAASQLAHDFSAPCHLAQGGGGSRLQGCQQPSQMGIWGHTWRPAGLDWASSNGGTARLVPHGRRPTFGRPSLYARIQPGDAKICSRYAPLAGRPSPLHRKTAPAHSHSLARRSTRNHAPGLPGGRVPWKFQAQVQVARYGPPGVVHTVRATMPSLSCGHCRCGPASAVSGVLHVHELASGCGAGTFRLGHECTGGSHPVVILCGPEIMIACESRHRPAGAWPSRLPACLARVRQQQRNEIHTVIVSCIARHVARSVFDAPCGPG